MITNVVQYSNDNMTVGIFTDDKGIFMVTDKSDEMIPLESKPTPQSPAISMAWLSRQKTCALLRRAANLS